MDDDQILTPMSAQQNQLTMSLLNNLLQMQGLESTIMNQQQQQSTTSTTTASTTAPNSSSASTTASPQQQQQQPPNSPTNASYNPQLLLEQQIKLTQLQQLQQLQNQIFQQQIALISGQSPGMVPLANIVDSTRGQNPSDDQHLFTGLPTPGPSGEIRPQKPSMDYMSPISLANYMEPLPHALISSPALSASSASLNTQSQIQGQRTHGSTTNVQRQSNSQGQGQGQGHVTTPTSPALSGFHHHQPQPQQVRYTHPNSPMYRSSHDHPIQTPSPSTYSLPGAMSPNTFGNARRDTTQSQQGQGQGRYTPANGNNSSNFNLTHYQHKFRDTQQQHNHTPITNAFSPSGSSVGPHSAPERVAFNIYTGPFPSTGSTGVHMSPSTVSASGATQTNGRESKSWKLYNSTNNASSSSSSSSSSSPPLPILDQDISPLTSPWLGARPTSEVGYGAAAGSPIPMNKIPTSPSSPSLPASSSIAATTSTKSNKRSANASDDDEDSNPRKKQSPAIRPILRMSGLSSVGGTRGIDTREGDGATVAAERLKMDKSATPTPPPSASTAYSDDIVSRSGSAGGNPIQGGDRDWDNRKDGEESSGGKDAGSTSSTSTATNTTFRRPAYRGSKSTTSTPLLRSMSTTGRLVSLAGSGSNPNSGSNIPDPSAASGSGSMNTGTGTVAGPTRTKSRPSRGAGGSGGRDDSPSSPADVSMPPPPVPNGNSTREISTMPGMNMDVDMRFGMGMDMDMSGMGMDMSGMGMGNMGNMGMGMNMNMGMDMGMMGMDLMMGFMDDIDFGEQRQQTNPAPLVPVTPASIMNMGRLGARQHPTPTPTPPTRQTRRKEPTTAGVSTRSNARSSRKNAVPMSSPSLKPILPAGSVTPNLDPALSSPMFSPSISASAPNTPRTLLPAAAMPGPSSTRPGAANHHNNTSQQQQPIHVRKTSHKAAEQKRRDSLKTTFDDLRKLLPPILVPNDSSSPSLGPSTPHPSSFSQANHSSSTSSGSPHSPIFLATTPLLPGSLPPRGPPKAGGEGPNKGVSKLQLLICGNEFIRLLKARVERRDEEIKRLRREVGRLRSLVGSGGGAGGDAEAEAMEMGGMAMTLLPSSSSTIMARIDEDREGENEALNGEDGEDEELDLERDLDAIERIPPCGGGLGSVRLTSNGNGSSPTGGGGDDQMNEGDDEGDDLTEK